MPLFNLKQINPPGHLKLNLSTTGIIEVLRLRELDDYQLEAQTLQGRPSLLVLLI